jgi:hypothetical protein
MQTLAQATFALLLAGHAKTLDVVFGIVLGCRDSEEDERIMFPTMNTVPLRILLHGSGAEILRHVQGIANDILPFQRTPLRTIQAASASVVDARDADRGSGLFDALFIYQQTASQESEQAPKLYESIDGAAEIEYPLAVELQVVKQELVVRVASKDVILSEQETAQLLEQFDKILALLINSHDKPIISFSGDEASVCGMPAFKLDTSDSSTSESSNSQDTSHDNEAADPTTDTICKVLSEVAKLPEPIGRDTAFDSIGIDSISAIKVSSLLRKQDIKISVSQMLKAKTPRRMAEAVQAHSGTPATRNVSSKDVIATALKDIDLGAISSQAQISPSNIERILPATAGQVYMLNLWRATDGQLFYPTFKFHVNTERSVEDLCEAWNKIVEQQAILRTIFVQSGNAAVPILQVVLKAGAKSFSAANETNGITPTQEHYASLHATPASDGYDIDLKIHHALYDAVSLPLLLQDLQRILDGQPVSPPSVIVDDFLALSLTKEAQTSRQAFWTKYLHDLRPITARQPATQGAQNKVEIFQPSLTASCNNLETLARQHQISIQALLFAVYAKLHAQHLSSQNASSEATDIVVGIYLSNRGHLPDLDQLAYPTLNLVPLCIRNVLNTNIIESAKEIQADLAEIGTAENSCTALWEIEQWTGVKVDLFLNFLKVPEISQDHTELEEDGKGGRSRIEEIEGGRKMPRRRVENVERSLNDDEDDGGDAKRRGEFDCGRGYQVCALLLFNAAMRGRSFTDADVQHAVDVEMTVTDQGEMDFGLFAPESMLGLEDGETLVKSVKEELEKLLLE